MLPDYGLEDLAGAENDEAFNDEDTFNDDTFGTSGLGESWAQGNEQALWDGAKLHEDFLSGDINLAAGTESGGFFGDLGGSSGAGILLEDMPTFDDDLGDGDDDDFDMGSLATGSLGALELPTDDDALTFDPDTLAFLDAPSPHPSVASATKVRGLRVAGLPTSLDEAQTKQLMAHFGPLAHFELQRGALSNTAVLSYQNPTATESARAQMQGIPLGGRCARRPCARPPVVRRQPHSHPPSL